jgi:hypothetical protein
MKELRMISELVGGPCDGEAWLSDSTRHWSQRITWGERKPGTRSVVWADYELKETQIVWEEEQPLACFRYHFVGFREWHASLFLRLLTPLLRWTRRQATRLRARASSQEAEVLPAAVSDS